MSVSGASSKIRRLRNLPSLIVTSRESRHVYSRHLYNLTLDNNNIPKLKLDRKLDLPQISHNLIVGSSQGYLLSTPAWGRPRNNIHAINPLTGHVLHIPSVSGIFREDKHTKVVLSPTLDRAVFLPNRAVFLPNRRDTRFSSRLWTTLPVPWPLYHVSDCLFHKGCLFLANHFGAIAIFDDAFFNRPSSPCPHFWTFPLDKFDAAFLNQPSSHFYTFDEDSRNTTTKIMPKCKLMESHDGNDLYALFRNTAAASKSLEFRLFKLDRSFHQWEEVESIGDSFVFVGTNHALSFSAHDFPLLQPNSIYFTGYAFGNDLCDDGNNTTGAYCLKNRSFEYFGATQNDQILTLTDLTSIWFEPVAT